MTTGTILQVRAVSVGTPALLMERRGEQVYSGIRKRWLPDGPVIVGHTNIEGDGQADLVNHGGPDKAIYVYPSEHFAAWEAEIGYRDEESPFGENLTIAGITEGEARIGDIWRWGEVRLQISQPRWPCFKLAVRTGHLDMVKRFVASGRCGWYMRVLTTGTADTRAPAEIEAIDPVGLTVREAFEANLNRNSLSSEDRTRIASHPVLSAAWREMLTVNG